PPTPPPKAPQTPASKTNSVSPDAPHNDSAQSPPPATAPAYPSHPAPATPQAAPQRRAQAAMPPPSKIYPRPLLRVLCVPTSVPSVLNPLFLRNQPPQNSQRRLLSLRRQISRGPHTRRTPRLARAPLNQLPSLPHQQRVRPEQRLRKSNPPRISVIQIQIRLKKLLRLRPHRLFQPHRHELLTLHARHRRPLPNRRPQIPPIAHQQQCRHRRQRVQKPIHPRLSLADAMR